MRLAALYSLLALIATGANIGAQEVTVRVLTEPRGLLASVLIGTIAGLFVKYVLDKRYIFRFRAADAMHDTQTFVLYTLMGVLTTAVFWAFELGFQHVFHTKEMRYLGGVLGLGLGYFLKYHLDKRYVFVNPNTALRPG